MTLLLKPPNPAAAFFEAKGCDVSFPPPPPPPLPSPPLLCMLQVPSRTPLATPSSCSLPPACCRCHPARRWPPLHPAPPPLHAAGTIPRAAGRPFILLSVQLSEVRGFSDLFTELMQQVELTGCMPRDLLCAVLSNKPSTEYTAFQVGGGRAGQGGQCVRLMVHGPGSRVQGPGSRVQGQQGPGSRVQGPGSKAQGLECPALQTLTYVKGIQQARPGATARPGSTARLPSESYY